MPRIWADSLEQHKADVRSAVMSAAAELASSGGVRSLTMSQIAQHAGISRATLYTYFADVDQILNAWHRWMVDSHLSAIEETIERAQDDPVARLIAACDRHIDVLITHHNNPLLQPHQGSPETVAAVDRLHQAFTSLVAAALPRKADRGNLSAANYASYVLAALEAGARLQSRTARQRLIALLTRPHRTLGGDVD